eukprot:3176356-Prymnesium_polylepis.1
MNVLASLACGWPGLVRVRRGEFRGDAGGLRVWEACVLVGLAKRNEPVGQPPPPGGAGRTPPGS